MAIKGFKQFSEDTSKVLYATFGRFNPPTKGHQENIEVLAKMARGHVFRIYASHSNDPNKNPLGYEEKIKFMRKMFPKYARNIILDKTVKNTLNIASAAYNDGFTKLIFAVGSDRVSEFKSLLVKYNGVKSTHGYYNFRDGISVVSTGNRDPDGESSFLVSASNMRKAVAENDYKTFSNMLPSGFTDGKKLFIAIKRGMGIEESIITNSRDSFYIDDLREAYLNKGIFNIGDEIYSVAHDKQKFTIIERHSNYIIAKNAKEERKFFIESVYPVDEIKGAYYAGLKKSTAEKRRAHFNKNAKKSDEDDSAYRPAPGDSTAETKPSKYTKLYKARFEESSSPVEKSLKKKSEASGISFSILKDVYDRGHAAWRTGHRPGTTPEQWGLARVNSFIVGGQTRKTTDFDLWDKHKNEIDK
jgi:hypothetical protein